MAPYRLQLWCCDVRRCGERLSMWEEYRARSSAGKGDKGSNKGEWTIHDESKTQDTGSTTTNVASLVA